MRVFFAPGVLLTFLVATTWARALLLTGPNWQVLNVSNNQAPAVFERIERLAWHAT